ncbi:hypothetical protein D3C79_205900 [compost metagenome]
MLAFVRLYIALNLVETVVTCLRQCVTTQQRQIEFMHRFNQQRVTPAIHDGVVAAENAAVTFIRIFDHIDTEDPADRQVIRPCSILGR